MAQEESMEDFLKKIDEIGSIVKDLNSGDSCVKDEALKKADEYLAKVKGGENDTTKFDRTIINKEKKNDERYEMDKEEFMRSVEKDIENRKKLQQKNLKEALKYKEKGNEYLKCQKFAEANNCYTQAIQLVPDNVIFYANRAQGYLYLGEYDKAVHDCDLGIKIDKSFIKCYVRKGKALKALHRFSEAESTFKEILIVDKKSKVMVNEYIEEVAKAKNKKLLEDKINSSLEQDESLKSVQRCLQSLEETNSVKDVFPLLSSLRLSLKTGDQKHLFSMLNGFDTLEKIWLSYSEQYDVEKLLLASMEVMEEACIDFERNCAALVEKDVFLKALLRSVSSKTSSVRCKSIKLSYLLTEFKEVRRRIVDHEQLKVFVDGIFEAIGEKSHTISFYSIGVLNHLALEDTFVKDYGKMLSEKFVNSVLILMELIGVSDEAKHSFANFLPIMKTSVGTLTNLFRNSTMITYSDPMKIWSTTCKFMLAFIRDDVWYHDMVYASLGMLSNLSACSEKLACDKETYNTFLFLMNSVVDGCEEDSIERCCTVLYQVTKNNDDLLELAFDNNIDTLMLKLVKTVRRKSFTSFQNIIKCVALMSKRVDKIKTSQVLDLDVVSDFLSMMASNDEQIVGNVALIFESYAKIDVLVDRLKDRQLIQLLLRQATNENFSQKVRYNCAVTISKYSLADQSYLDELRALHGLEILHQVLQNNTL